MVNKRLMYGYFCWLHIFINQELFCFFIEIIKFWYNKSDINSCFFFVFREAARPIIGVTIWLAVFFTLRSFVPTCWMMWCKSQSSMTGFAWSYKLGRTKQFYFYRKFVSVPKNKDCLFQLLWREIIFPSIANIIISIMCGTVITAMFSMFGMFSIIIEIIISGIIVIIAWITFLILPFILMF